MKKIVLAKSHWLIFLNMRPLLESNHWKSLINTSNFYCSVSVYFVFTVKNLSTEKIFRFELIIVWYDDTNMEWSVWFDMILMSNFMVWNNFTRHLMFNLIKRLWDINIFSITRLTMLLYKRPIQTYVKNYVLPPCFQQIKIKNESHYLSVSFLNHIFRSW